MQVYQKVSLYISNKNISHKDVADKCGLCIDEFEKILCGKEILYADILLRICFALNVSPELFIE